MMNNNNFNNDSGSFNIIVKTFPEDFLRQTRFQGSPLIKPIVEMLDVSQWDELKAEYAEAQKYEKKLIEKAGDYQGVADDELYEILLKAEQFVENLYEQILNKISECYFNYEESLVRDLSIHHVNKTQIREWIQYDYEDNNQSNVYQEFTEFFNLNDIFNCLGGSFWKGKILVGNELKNTSH